jgi:hypothetical protein
MSGSRNPRKGAKTAKRERRAGAAFFRGFRPFRESRVPKILFATLGANAVAPVEQEPKELERR